MQSADAGDLRERVIAALHGVRDPELPMDIVELGLIYELQVSEGDVQITMTLTAPGCPVAQAFPASVEQTVLSVAGVRSAHVELVFDPPWDISRMSEAARLQLGMTGL